MTGSEKHAGHRPDGNSSGGMSDVAEYLRNETVGGVLLILATVAALLWANLDYDNYEAFRNITVGPESLHLDLTLETWAKDGLLAVFFFIAGLELKRELVVGELREIRRAMLPLFGALGGMILPAIVFIIVARGTDGWTRGWAIPTATDIAFALGIMSLVAASLPRNLRTYLLSLAIVDDLGAIILIAVLFTSDLAPVWLLVSAGLLALYSILQRRRVTAWYIYVPLAVLVWVAVHDSGVHATIAGVALGMLTRVKRDPGEDHSPAERVEHRLQPFSAGFCVPVFALLAAGVPLSAEALQNVGSSPIAQGIIAGLVIGKPIGILGGSALAVTARVARLPRGVNWRDLSGVGLVAGVGFTVSLLMASLAFDGDPALIQVSKTAVLVGSTVMGLLGAAVLYRRSKVRRLKEPGLRAMADRTLELDAIGPEAILPANSRGELTGPPPDRVHRPSEASGIPDSGTDPDEHAGG